jgi:hypothetical protein
MTKAKFGFSTVVIDMSYTVYTCKIIVDNPVVPPYFEHKGILVNVSSIQKKTKKLGERTVDRYSIRYCTMDWKEKFQMQQQIGAYLRNNAMNKLYQKWDWLQQAPEQDYTPSHAVEEVELDMEDLPKWEEYPA